MGLEGPMARQRALEPSAALDEARLDPRQGVLPPTLRPRSRVDTQVPLPIPVHTSVDHDRPRVEALVAPRLVVVSHELALVAQGLVGPRGPLVGPAAE